MRPCRLGGLWGSTPSPGVLFSSEEAAPSSGWVGFEGAGEAAEAGRNWGVCGEAGGGRESTEAGGAGPRSPLARGVWGVRSQGVTRDQRHCMCRKKSFTNLIVIISAFGTYFPVLQNLKNRI